MLYSARISLLAQICIKSVFFVIQIPACVAGEQIVEKIKIKIFHIAFFKLFFKYLFVVNNVFFGKSGEFGCQIKAVAGVIFKHLPAYDLAVSVVVTESGVEIIYSVFDRVIKNLSGFFGVDLGVIVINNGEAHGSQTQSGQLFVLKSVVKHIIYLVSRCRGSPQSRRFCEAAHRLWFQSASGM